MPRIAAGLGPAAWAFLIVAIAAMVATVTNVAMAVYERYIRQPRNGTAGRYVRVAIAAGIVTVVALAAGGRFGRPRRWRAAPDFPSVATGSDTFLEMVARS
jgi:hypothetical protein